MSIDPSNTAEEILRIASHDGVDLAVGAHPADDADAPVALIVHGIASHMGWYRPMARSLAERGVSTYTADRRGSGISGGPRGHLPHWKDAIADIIRIRDELARRHPGRPIVPVGISLGGMFLTAAAILHPDAFSGLVLSAPALATTVKVPLIRRLRVFRRSIFEPTHLYDLPFGPKDITDRKDWTATLESDDLRTRAVSARFLVEMFAAQRFVKKHIRKLQLPTYCLLASHDSLINNPRVAQILNRAQSKRLWIETFEDAPHVLPSVIPRAALFERVRPWLHATPPDGRRVFTSPIPADESMRQPRPPVMGKPPQ
ncbi:MAG: hypothetical protein CMJ83_12890 [Planctomycetes bacterium]|nr:hypothetical protein [Planctomycetota bacterium]